MAEISMIIWCLVIAISAHGHSSSAWLPSTSIWILHRVDQQQAVSQLERRGALVEFSHSAYFNWWLFGSSVIDNVTYQNWLAIVDGVDLMGGEITKHDLRFLTKLPHIKELYVEGISLENTDLLPLSRLRKLEILGLHRTRVTAEGLHVVRNNRRLRELTFDARHSESLRPLSALTSLERLRIDNARLSASDIVAIRKLEKLKTLHLRNGRRRSALEQLDFGDWESLREIILVRKNLSQQEWSRVFSNIQLEKVDIVSTVLDGADLADLDSITGLKYLSLENVRLSSGVVSQIAKLDRLVYLSLFNCNVDNDMLQELSQMTQLRQLDVTGTLVHDRGIKSFRLPQHLELLVVSEATVSEAVVVDVTKRRPEIKVIRRPKGAGIIDMRTFFRPGR